MKTYRYSVQGWYRPPIQVKLGTSVVGVADVFEVKVTGKGTPPDPASAQNRAAVFHWLGELEEGGFTIQIILPGTSTL